jgi:peptide/nickel transport system substrate-binding protein
MPGPHAPLALIAALAIAATGCGGGAPRGAGEGGSASYASNGTFTMAVSIDVASLNPYTSQLAVGINPLAYDSLVNLGSDGSLVSGLAEKWSATPDSATFTLRRGVTCSDGSPLTASHVADVMAYVSEPNNAPAQYGLSVPIVPYTATGDDAARTVTVTTEKPFGLLPNTIGLLPIVCPKGLKDPKTLTSASDGTGPYVITNAVSGQTYTYAVRRGYAWGPDGAATTAPGLPAKVVIRLIPSKTTQANLLLSGELNYGQVNEEDMGRLTGRGLENIEYPVAGTWLFFNQLQDRPGADRRVRQALVSALNFPEVIKVSTVGTGTAPTSLVALTPRPCRGDTVTGQPPKYDVAAAGTLLDQAGWVKGADGFRAKGGKALELTLPYAPDYAPLDQPTAEFLSQRWKAIGVKVKLTPVTAGAMQQVLFKTSNWDVYTGGSNVNLPSQLLSRFSGPVPPKGTNYAGIDNKEYKALADKALTMRLPDACAYWNQAEQAIIRNVDVTPIANRAQHVFLNRARLRLGRYAGPVPTSIRVLK